MAAPNVGVIVFHLSRTFAGGGSSKEDVRIHNTGGMRANAPWHGSDLYNLSPLQELRGVVETGLDS